MEGILKSKEMTIKEIQIKSTKVWLVIDQLRTYSEDLKFIAEKDEFLCYYKFSEPTPMIYGELLRDEEQKPRLFKSVNEAIEYTKEHLNKIL